MKKRLITLLDGQDFHPEFHAEIVVDSESLDCTTEYYAAGVHLLKKELTSPIARKYAGHSLIAKDLKYLIKMMRYASSIAIEDSEKNKGTASVFVRDEIDLKSDMLKTIYIAAVVTYGKCFSQAHGRRVKLDREKVFESAEQSLLKTHDDVMNQRHEYVAHGGNTKYESAKTLMLLHPSEGEGLPPLITCSSMHVCGFSKSAYSRFLKLFEYVQVKHHETMKMMNDAVRKQEIEGKNLGEIYETFNS